MPTKSAKPAESSSVGGFHIRGYVRYVRSDRVVATVIATRTGEGPTGTDEVVERECKSQEAAIVALRELTVELGNRIRGRGDTVVDVQTFGA